MICVDKDIRIFLQNGDLKTPDVTSISCGDPNCVTNIGYDLRANAFYAEEKHTDSYDLQPGSSVVVESVEIIHFDKDTCGRICSKNSRIRQGLSVDSPVFQPGHTTRVYFRLTNISADMITLSAGGQYAMLMFEQLSDSPDSPYDGTFQDEYEFRGLADYSGPYSAQNKRIEKKRLDLEALEKSIYGNVITILTVFIAIFSLININFSLANASAGALSVLIYNLSTLGAISFLSILLHTLLGTPRRSGWLWIIPVVCFAAVGIAAFFI